MFKLYEGTGNQRRVHPLDNEEVEGVNGQANKTFQDLKVSHHYECRVRVITSSSGLTPPTFKSKWTKMPQEIKLCTQPFLSSCRHVLPVHIDTFHIISSDHMNKYATIDVHLLN